MFKVIDKETNLPVTVYHIRMDSSGYPVFLVYGEEDQWQNGRWLWKSAKYFKPMELED